MFCLSAGTGFPSTVFLSHHSATVSPYYLDVGSVNFSHGRLLELSLIEATSIQSALPYCGLIDRGLSYYN